MIQEDVNNLFQAACNLGDRDIHLGRFLQELVTHLAAAHGLEVQEPPPPEEQIVTEVPPVENTEANATEPSAIATRAHGTTMFAPTDDPSLAEQQAELHPGETRPEYIGLRDGHPEDEQPIEKGE